MSQSTRISTSASTISAAGHDVSPLNADEITELAKSLSAEERRVLLHQGTESAFCGNLLDNKK